MPTEVAHRGQSSSEATRIAWAVAALAISLLPHVGRLPGWVLLLFALASAWRLGAANRGWPLPSTVIRMVITAAGFLLVLATYRTVNGLYAGSALLAVMMALKLLETRQRRDLQVLMFIAYFMVAALLLDRQEVWTLPYLIVATWLITVSLLQAVREGEPLPLRTAAGMVTRMLAAALPIAALLFVLFPRVPGPFWAMPSSGAGTTGLSDTMSPGTVSKLSLSDAVAFRVEFRDEPPPPSQRYWRGPVLHHFNGSSWRQPSPLPLRKGTVETEGRSIRYRVTLEPTDRRWLMALDVPSDWTWYDAWMADDLQLRSRRPVDRLIAYEARSWPDFKAERRLPGLIRKRSLQLPIEQNPRTRAMARELREQYANDGALVDAVLRHFREQPFVYTLQPPALLGRGPMDQFLFETRRGFCEHYASAFTLLMRAAGIPARVVTGYQGGELNPYTGQFVVRQRDAHAWAEVWLEGRGWTRVDPTGAVAPERIELSLEDALPEGEPVPGRYLRSSEFLRQLQLSWDALNSAWNEWILGYGPEKQRRLMEHLGFEDPDWRTLTAVLTAALGVVLGIVALTLAIRYKPRRADPVQRLYQRFVRRLARRGLDRRTGEGPVDFARRAADSLPGAADGIHAITGQYVALRYEPMASAEAEALAVAELRRIISRFRP